MLGIEYFFYNWWDDLVRKKVPAIPERLKRLRKGTIG